MFNKLNIQMPPMRLQELGFAVRQARNERGLTQAELAAAVGLSRTTVSQLENGLLSDLGVKKLQSVMEEVGLTLSVQPTHDIHQLDPFQMACTTASVSYKRTLTVDELIRGLLTGVVPNNRRPHFRTLLDEAPPILLRALVSEASRWSKPGRVQGNLSILAHDIGAARKVEEWMETA